MTLNESHVEEAALTWFGELGYAVAHGPHMAPGEPAAGHCGGIPLLEDPGWIHAEENYRVQAL